MTSKIRRLLLLLFVLFAVGCEPPPPRAPEASYWLGLDARTLLVAGKKCFPPPRDLRDLQTGGLDDQALASNGGAPPQNDPATIAVREPILKELLAYANAATPAEKAAHAQKLRELFESIPPTVAAPFLAKLETDDALAVTFRNVLKGDPLREELLGILDKNRAPPPVPQQRKDAPPPSTGLQLPFVELTDKASFDEFHKQIKEQIDVLERGAGAFPRDPARFWTQDCKALYVNKVVLELRQGMRNIETAKEMAFKQGDSPERAAFLRRIGYASLGAFLLTQIMLLDLNLIVETVNADIAGVPSVPNPLHPDERTPLNEPILAFEGDAEIQSLIYAAGTGHEAEIVAALPKGAARFVEWVQFLDGKWKEAIHKGAVASQKAIKLANIVTIAISIYQVWKIPVVVGGSAPPPPVVLGVLPGGAAISGQLSATSIATALESIRRLVAIGALDGAVIGTVGLMGGSPTATLPELQRPALSVQNPNAGGSPSAAQPAKLKPYKEAGGHHVPAKRAFEGAPNYDPKKALAIPTEELERLGAKHPVVTGKQIEEYAAFAKSGKPLTWEAIADIETNALVKAGMKPDVARPTVAKAIQALKDAGVLGPIRIPWGK